MLAVLLLCVLDVVIKYIPFYEIQPLSLVVCIFCIVLLTDLVICRYVSLFKC